MKQRFVKLASCSILAGTLLTMGMTNQHNPVFAAEKKGESSRILSDIREHWAELSIREMISLGLVKGKDDGLFHPEQQMTRAEFMTLLARSFGFQVYFIKAPDIREMVDDISADAWYAGEFIQAKHTFLPLEGRSFRPDDMLSREEMAEWVWAAYRVKLGEKLKPVHVQVPGYPDQEEINPAYLQAIGECASRGFIKGDHEGYFQPKGLVTRAQAAVAVVRLLKELPDELRQVPVAFTFHSQANHGKWDATPQALLITSNEEAKAFEEKWKDPSLSLPVFTPTNVDFGAQAVIALIGYPSSSSNPPVITAMVREGNRLTIFLEKKVGVIETADITGAYRFYVVAKQDVNGVNQLQVNFRTIKVNPE